MENKKKMNIVVAVWLFIWIVTMIVIKEVKADVKSAPRENLVRISIGTPTSDRGGSGFLINGNTVVTAKHVVDEEDVLYYVEYFDGYIERINWNKVRLSKTTDLATFKVKRRLLPMLIDDLVIQKTLAEIGDDIYLMSHPYAYRVPYFSIGIVGSEIVTMTFLDGSKVRVVMLDVHSVGGCSGSPVLNMNNEVVGVMVGSSRLITVMVDSATLLRFLR
jgi:S1-C subfamily serine protease